MISEPRLGKNVAEMGEAPPVQILSAHVCFGSKADISAVTFTAHGVIWAERSLGSKGGASPFSATFLLALIEAF